METLAFVKAKMDYISKENPHLKDLNFQDLATELNLLWKMIIYFPKFFLSSRLQD